MPESSDYCNEMTFCITCSDAAETMRLEAIGPGGAIGTCVDVLGHRTDVLLGLVPEASIGADVLVHAGVALLVTTARLAAATP